MTQAEAPWLWVSAPSEGAGVEALSVGELLREYRATHGGLSQTALADLLGITQTYVSRIENGTRRVRDVGLLYHIATCLGVPPTRLGLSHELVASVRLRAANQEHPGPGRHGEAQPDDPAGSVQASGDEWRLIRNHLNQHRADLARVAVRLYPPDVRVARVPLLARPDWLPARPVDFADIQLEWVTPGLGADISRPDLVSHTRQLADRIAARIDNCLVQAGLAPDNIDAVFLTGSSVKLAHVHKAITKAVPSARVVEGDIFGAVGKGLTLEALRRYGPRG